MIHCDNGPEYPSATIVTWAQQHGIRLKLFIQENLSRTPAWIWSYNHERPNMALGLDYAKTAAGHGCIMTYFCHLLKMGEYQRSKKLGSSKQLPRTKVPGAQYKNMIFTKNTITLAFII